MAADSLAMDVMDVFKALVRKGGNIEGVHLKIGDPQFPILNWRFSNWKRRNWITFVILKYQINLEVTGFGNTFSFKLFQFSFYQF